MEKRQIKYEVDRILMIIRTEEERLHRLENEVEELSDAIEESLMDERE